MRSYAITMRPYLLFVSGITGIAGMSLVPAASPTWVAWLGLAFFLSYGFGQALTDCFQVDTDSLSAPYRPLVQGTVRRGDVMAVSLIGLAAVGGALIVANPWNLPLVGASGLGLITYTWFKRRWWAGPFYNAWIVAALALIGTLAAAGSAGLGTDLSSGGKSGIPTVALGGTLVAVFFGYANFVLVGYFKDISADRATGYRTLPVTVGLGVSSLVSDLFALVAVTGATLAVAEAPLLAGASTGPAAAANSVAALVFLYVGAAFALAGQLRVHRVRHEREAHRAIVPVVDAYLLLLCGIAAAHQPGWIPALALFFGAYMLAMRARPMREQI